MKKLMFNDRYGLTEAVLTRRKTMTRRIMPNDTPFGNWEETVSKSRYQVGEVVAVAQNYKDCGYHPDVLQQVYVKKPTIFPDLDPVSSHCGWVDLPFKYHKGWTNKMFVLPDLMPHRIRINDIKVERLQDISDEDCLKEGVHVHKPIPYESAFDGYSYDAAIDPQKKRWWFKTPKEAFAALIDRISGKGTWERNPYVFAYTFELVK